MRDTMVLMKQTGQISAKAQAFNEIHWSKFLMSPNLGSTTVMIPRLMGDYRLRVYLWIIHFTVPFLSTPCYATKSSDRSYLMIFTRVNISQSSHWIAEVGGGDQHCRELSIPNLLLFMIRIRDWTGFCLFSFPDPGSPPRQRVWQLSATPLGFI